MEMEVCYMKKKFILVFFAILILTASLSGVVLAETDLSGAWDNDYDEFSLVSGSAFQRL